MYAQLEEDHGLAKRAMSIYDRATQVVADGDKFEVRIFYAVTCKQRCLCGFIFRCSAFT
jgi:hypothetical protein